MRNTPWFHQRRSESAPPAERTKEPPNITQEQQDEMVDRISRPTESARYRQSLFWKLDGYMDKGFHSWSKMELFEDCKQCMWTPNGTIKNSCKIRPINVVLPPLLRSREVTSSADNSSSNNNNNSGRHSGPVCMSQSESRCESRRAVLRPRPSLERSRTSFVATRPKQSSTSSSSSSMAHHRLPRHHNTARSFMIRNFSTGKVPAHFGSFTKQGGVSTNNMAVPRMIENPTTATSSALAAN